MKTRTEFDGTVTLTTEDGRRFTLSEYEGEITIASHDGDLLMKPISSAEVTLDTPLE